MTSIAQTPCQHNNDISLEKHRDRVRHAEMLDVAVQASAASPARKQAVHEVYVQTRLEYHPDHWFLDPLAGRETEDGRLRRRAKEACWADCPMKARLLCLDIGMQPGPTSQHGIYGGYDESERIEIMAEIAKRKKRAAPLQTQ